jgi:glycosyltransferase involved in cell wall biosynthesis
MSRGTDDSGGSTAGGSLPPMVEPHQVSFVVPARNEARDIAGCISSLHGQEGIGQAEIIVVDNGSSDDTAAIAAQMGARVVHEAQPGLAWARQAGLAAAAGEFLVFVDADSRLPPRWTAEVLQLFAEDAGLVAMSTDFAFHDGRLVDDVGRFMFCSLLNPFANQVLRLAGRPGVLIGSAIALRTAALLDVGGIDVRFPFYGEDTALAYRLHQAGDVRFIRRPAYQTSARRYRQHGIASVVFRYFSVFGLLHLGRDAAAQTVSEWFQQRDRRAGQIPSLAVTFSGLAEPPESITAPAD